MNIKKFAIILVFSIQIPFINNLPALGTGNPAFTIKPTEKPNHEDVNGSTDSLAINSPAPDFYLRDLKGKWYSLKDLKGKIVVLNFWFIACKPCVNEMPVLNAIKESYDPAQVIFLALSLDHRDAIHDFLKGHQFEYTILPGSKETADKYKMNAYPASVVIDNKGITRFIQIGGPNIRENLSKAIERALKRKC